MEAAPRYQVPRRKTGQRPLRFTDFSPMRRFLQRAYLRPVSEGKQQVVEALRLQAAQGVAANPQGPEWVIEVPIFAEAKTCDKSLAMQNCQINCS